MATIAIFAPRHGDTIEVGDAPLYLPSTPLEVGAALEPRNTVIATQRDDEGTGGKDRDDKDAADSLSAQYQSYGEYTATYWAWKHVDADFIGIAAPDRPFLLPGIDRHATAQEAREEAEAAITSHDFVAFANGAGSEAGAGSNAAEDAASAGTSVYQQYCEAPHHHAIDLDTCLAIMQTQHPTVWTSARRYLKQSRSYSGYAVIMRRELFADYCAFLFSVLGQHAALCDTSHYPQTERATARFLGDVLTGVYVDFLLRTGHKGLLLDAPSETTAQSTALTATAASSGNQAQGGNQASAQASTRPSTQPSAASPAAAVSAASSPTPAPELPGSEFTPMGLGKLREHVKLDVRIDDAHASAFTHVTRGGGKIFGLLTPGVALRSARLSVRAQTASGMPAPAKIVQSPHGPALVLAELGQNQTVTLTALRRGEITAIQRIPIDAEAIKLRSRVHVLRKDGISLALRRCDEGHLPGDAKVYLDSIVDGYDGADIVRGHVAIPVHDAAEEHAYVEVTALDSTGVPFGIADWVCMGDHVDDSPNYPGLRVRTVSFSVRTPVDAPFYIWAHFPDADCQDGFQLFDAVAVSSVRSNWVDYTRAASFEPNYDPWLRAHQQNTPEELALQRAATFAHLEGRPGAHASAQTDAHAGKRPLYSFVVPMHGGATPADLRRMANSVMEQSYEDWELLLVGAAADSARDAAKPASAARMDEDIAKLLNHDHRVRTVDATEPLSAAQTMAHGIAAARGDFIITLGLQDFVEPRMLYTYTRALDTDPALDVIYGDEDQFEIAAEPGAQPSFHDGQIKTDWNPDMFIARDIVGHSVAIRRDTIVHALAAADAATESAAVEGAAAADAAPTPLTAGAVQSWLDAGFADAEAQAVDADEALARWNLSYRATEATEHITHVPQVLYHWRGGHDTSLAEPDSPEHETMRALVQAHLDRLAAQHKLVTAEGDALHAVAVDAPRAPGRFAAHYDIVKKGIAGTDLAEKAAAKTAGAGEAAQAPTTPAEIRATYPLVSIVIPNKDAADVLNRCITSILKLTTYPNYEIVIVENNSTEQQTFDYYDMLERLDPRIHVTRDTEVHGFNFSQICNWGVQHSHGEYILLLNNDTEVMTHEWIELLLGPCQRADVGIVGAQLLYPDSAIQHAGVAAADSGPAHQYMQLASTYPGNMQETMLTRDLAAVTGACMIVSRADYDAVGGYDEGLAVNYNDVDFCMRMLAHGKRVVYCPEARLHHYESVSRGFATTTAKQLAFLRERGQFMARWPQMYDLSCAPFASTNLRPGVYSAVNNELARPQMW